MKALVAAIEAATVQQLDASSEGWPSSPNGEDLPRAWPPARSLRSDARDLYRSVLDASALKTAEPSQSCMNRWICEDCMCLVASEPQQLEL